MPRKHIIAGFIFLLSTSLWAQLGHKGSSYFQSTMHSLNVVMHIVDKYPYSVNTLLDPVAAELFYDLMEKAEELEDRNQRRDLFWKESIEQTTSSDLELIEIQPLEAVFVPFSEDPEKFKEFRSKYKGEIYNTIKSKTFAIKALNDYKKETLGYVTTSKAQGDDGAARPYIRIFSDSISPEQVIKVVSMVMKAERADVVFIAQRTPYIQTLDIRRTTARFNGNTEQKSIAYLVSEDMLKEALIKDLKKEFKQFRDWKNTIEHTVRGGQKKYYMGFEPRNSIPKWKRAVVIASYLDAFVTTDEPSLNVFYNKIYSRFEITKDDIALARTMINKDYQSLDPEKIKRLKDMGVKENTFKQIFSTAPSNFIATNYSDNADIKALFRIIDEEASRSNPDVDLISSSWTKIMLKSSDDQWADRFINILGSEDTKLSIKKAMISSLSFSERIPSNIFSIIDKDWVKYLDIASVFNNKKNLPWEFWEQVIKIIKEEKQTFLWWNTLKKFSKWPNSFREHVPGLMNFSEARILMALAEQELLTKEEYQAVADLMSKTNLSRDEIYSINYFLKKRTELPKIIWERMSGYSTNIGLNDSQEMLIILSNKEQLPKEIIRSLYSQIKFESRSVALNDLTEPEFLKLFGSGTTSNIFFGHRQFNESASALRMIKFYNEKLYLMRHKYKTMGTTELLKEFQDWIDVSNYENKYGNNYLPSEKTYYSAVDLMLSDDFDLMLENVHELFSRDLPMNVSYSSNSAYYHQSNISELLSNNVARDYFLITELDIRLRGRMLRYPEGNRVISGKRADPLNIFSDYGLLVGFLGEDPTMSMPDYNYSLKYMYGAALNKILNEEGIAEENKRIFATEGRFVSNLREYAASLKNRSDKALNLILKGIVPKSSDLGGQYEKDIEDFIIYALESISETPNTSLVEDKIEVLAECLPAPFDIFRIADSKKIDQSNPLWLKNAIRLMSLVSDDNGPKAQNIISGMDQRFRRSLKDYKGPVISNMISAEEVVQILQSYTGSRSSDLETLREKTLSKIALTEGKLNETDIDMLFGKDNTAGYYDYLANNITSEQDICELILLSAICYESDNFNSLSRTDLRFIAGTFSKVNPVYESRILPMYEKQKQGLKGPIALIKSKTLSSTFTYGYKRLIEIKY